MIHATILHVAILQPIHVVQKLLILANFSDCNGMDISEYTNRLGDFHCDDGEGLSGIDFACSKFLCDIGDCAYCFS